MKHRQRIRSGERSVSTSAVLHFALDGAQQYFFYTNYAIDRFRPEFWRDLEDASQEALSLADSRNVKSEIH